ncbi:hypothetical protein [Streptomyces hundungensis]|uniref:hypothetical protein n=1 Tax=Streptomyces hundungensis TaxID=1077946 RepID=UPI0033D3C706
MAFLRGDYTVSTVLGLTVARIRCRTDINRAAPEVVRQSGDEGVGILRARMRRVGRPGGV